MLGKIVIYFTQKVLPLIILLLILWTVWCNYIITQIYYNQMIVTKAQQMIRDAQAQQQQARQQNMGAGPVRQPQDIPQKPQPEQSGVKK